MSRKQPRKERLIETAAELFNRHGFRATGIDTILAESGVSKATLYKYFSGKEDLIIEVLKRRSAAFEAANIERLRQYRSDHPSATGKEAVLTLFDLLHEWINSERFFGCNFIHAAGEFGDCQNSIRQFAAQHKERNRIRILDLLEGEVKDANVRAEMLVLLMDGAIVSAHVRGLKNAAMISKKAAAELLCIEKL